MARDRTVSAAALAVVYEDCQDTVRRVCRAFRRCHGGEPGELLAEANLHFVRACRRHDPARADFEHYLSYFVWKNLLERARKLARERSRYEAADVSKRPAPDTAPSGLAALLADLGEDATTAVRLLFEPDMGIRVADHRKQSALGRYRARLRLRLEELGWPPARTARAFIRVKEALT